MEGQRPVRRPAGQDHGERLAIRVVVIAEDPGRGDVQGAAREYGVPVIAGKGRLVADVERDRRHRAVRDAVVRAIGERVGARETAVRRVGERTVGVERQRAVRRAGHEHGR